MNQLARLANPFPERYIKKAPQGKYGDYIEHGTVKQALLAVVGTYTFRVKEIVRGDVPERVRVDKKTGERHVDPALTDVAVAVLASLTVRVDGETDTVEDVGDCDQPHNWTTDGQRLKDAISDAIKRCAVHVGVGLHLYCQEDYFLDRSLKSRDGAQGDPETATLSHETNGTSAPEGGDHPRGESPPLRVPKVAQKLDGPAKPKDPALVAMRIAARKLAEKEKVDIDAECRLIGKKLDDMDKSDVELLMTAIKEGKKP